MHDRMISWPYSSDQLCTYSTGQIHSSVIIAPVIQDHYYSNTAGVLNQCELINC